MKRYSLWKLKDKNESNETNEINLESNVIQRKISVNILAALPFLSVLFIHINLWCIMATKKKSVIALISLHPLDVETLMIFTLHECPKRKYYF